MFTEYFKSQAVCWTGRWSEPIVRTGRHGGGNQWVPES